MRRRRLFLLLPGALGMLAGAGCGRKPPFVDPPPDLEVDTFPRSYPPADPAPDSGEGGQAGGGGRRQYPAS